MLRFEIEEGPAEPTEEPTLPEVENALPEDVQDSALQNIESLGPIFGMVLNMAIGVLAGLVLTGLVALTVRIIMRRKKRMLSHMSKLLMPAFVAMAFLGARVGLTLSGEGQAVYNLLAFLLLIGSAAGFAWLALRVVNVIERRVEIRYDELTTEDRRGRRIRTQMRLIKRVLNTIIIVIAVSAILLAIPQVRALGAGLLASAGLVSVVAALAVQTTLTNVFAGIQLAFTDAIRVGDVVVVDEYYGTIEDITMSYVVLKIWDGRRVIYPSSYFTTTPFENYTRTGNDMLTAVDFDMDWRAPVDKMRARLRALVESSDLWDGRDVNIQVIDVMENRARVRAAVSARNPGEVWDLGCLVREDLMKFVSEEYPEAVTTTRIENLRGPMPVVEGSELESQQTPERDPSLASARRGDPVDMNSVPEVDIDTVQAWRNGEPPVERGSIPTVSRQQEDVETGPDTSSVPLTQASEYGSMYTGSIAAIERGQDMAGPGEDAYRSRQQSAEEAAAEDDIDTDEDDQQSGRQ